MNSSGDATKRWQAWHTVVLLCFAAVFISYIDRTNISVASIAMQDEFHWNEKTKGVVLSSFFVGYIVLQLASGRIANRYGGRMLLGFAVLWWSAFTMLTPPAAYMSFGMLIAARIALGLGEAAVFPASINMIGRWVPLEHRTRSVALFTSALSLGTVFSLPVTGWLVRGFGWPIPFYAFGALGIVWAIFWFARVREGRGVSVEVTHDARSVPWSQLLRTPAVWAIVVTHFSTNWALYVLLAWLPTYFKTAFGITLANAGLLSAAPSLATFVSANVAGHIAASMLKAGKSATSVRKFMTAVGTLGTALFLVCVPLATTATVGVLIMCGATACIAFNYSGYAPNSFDIAPNHADVIWGISNTFATIPGIVGVAITGWLVDSTGGFTAPFLVTCAVLVVGGATFMAIGSGERKIA